MEPTTVNPLPCRSIFCEDCLECIKERYTQLWANLINQMERSKHALAAEAT